MSLRLQGIFPPVTTPFDHAGNIYVSKVQHNVEKWNRTALSGYVVMGSTGESVMLTTEEKIAMWEMVAKHAAPEKLLIAGTGMESVRETVALTNRAAELGYKAAMVRTPHYYKNLVNRADAQTLYYRAVADQSRIPLIIYNWPQATGVDIPVEAVVAISEHPNVIAIKESSGNLEKVLSAAARSAPGLPGVGRLRADALALSADGRVRGHSRLCQRGPVFRDCNLGSLPPAGRGRGLGLAEPHRPRLRAGHVQVRGAGPEACDGLEWLLRWSASAAVVRADA